MQVSRLLWVISMFLSALETFTIYSELGEKVVFPPEDQALSVARLEWAHLLHLETKSCDAYEYQGASLSSIATIFCEAPAGPEQKVSV